ncbi:MAG: trypsin-like serine protease [Myxococcota bacterium]
MSRLPFAPSRATAMGLPAACALATCMLAMVPAVAHADPDDIATEDPDPLGVYGGNPVSACEWPTTVSLGGCTGTLVHPEVVIYAAHCGVVNQVFLGDSVNSQGRSVNPAWCKTYPGGGPGAGTDWAVCKLSQPVTDIAIAPPLMGCETEILQQGQNVWLVGFGNTDDGNFGVKYEAEAPFNYIQNNEAFIGGNGVDTCQGDSGGPVYVQLEDGSFRSFGITSYGDGCGGGGWYSMMHTGMEWFESETGVDITPCHDADGTWNPTDKCRDFATDPQLGNGSWPNSCAMGGRSEWSSTCGTPFAMDDDLDPPSVSITSPTDGTRFDSGSDGTVEIVIDIEASDEGSGIREVQLLLDGAALGGADTAAPYQYGVTLGKGTYELLAVAVDNADNSAESAVVNIGVDAEPPSAGGDGGGNDGGADGGGDGGGGGGDDGADDDDGGDGGDGGGPSDPYGALPMRFGQDGLDKGCGCTSTGSDGPWTWLSLLLLPALARRRRTH